MPWLDVIGWCGSALLIYSLMQSRVLRFRVLNLVASAVLTGFNAKLEIWPMVVMNLVLCAINLWHIRKLVGSRHDEQAFDVLEVTSTDEYLRHVLRVHSTDIAKFQPSLEWDGLKPGDAAFLIQRGDETVGVVLLNDAGDGVAQVKLDYVSQRFRDFSPGEFLWRRSHVLRDHGYHRVITPPNMVGAYYGRLGFTREADAWALDLV